MRSYPAKDHLSSSLLRECSGLADVNLILESNEKRIDKSKLPFGIKTFSSSASGAEGITLGPVVGLVTDHSVRILVQTNCDCELELRLCGRDAARREEHVVAPVKKTAAANVPLIFEVLELRPNYQYSVLFNFPAFDLVNSGFWTLPNNSNLADDPIKFAVVSGNELVYVNEKPYAAARDDLQVHKPTHSTDESLWKDLYFRIQQERIHYVIHIGNNIDVGYTSSSLGTTKSIFAECSEENLSVEEAVRRISQRYLEVWNEPYTKHVLANASNIMLLNESDIGKIVKLVKSQLKQADYRVAEAAFFCYQMYQQALAFNVMQNNRPKLQTNYISLTQNLKLLLVDWRVYPTFYDIQQNEHTLIGELGFDIIQKGLDASGEVRSEEQLHTQFAKSCQVLVLSSLQICNKHEYIHAPEYSAESQQLLALLFDWMQRGPKNSRSISIISGASQAAGLVGCIGRIVDPQSGQSISEWVVGPVSAPPHKKLASTKFRSGRFAFCLKKQIAFNNYAVVCCSLEFDSTERKEDADIHGTFVIAKPVAHIQYYLTTQAKKPVCLSDVGKGKKLLLRPRQQDSTQLQV